MEADAHGSGEMEHIDNGILNALGESQDCMLTDDLRDMWQDLQMPALRDQIVAEVNADVASGELHSFWQYAEILEPYDDHPPVRGGFEDAEAEVHEDDDDGGGGGGECCQSGGSLTPLGSEDEGVHSDDDESSISTLDDADEAPASAGAECEAVASDVADCEALASAGADELASAVPTPAGGRASMRPPQQL